MMGLFRRKPFEDPCTLAARVLANAAADKKRGPIRARVDLMRAEMGMPPIDWPERRAECARKGR